MCHVRVHLLCVRFRKLRYVSYFQPNQQNYIPKISNCGMQRSIVLYVLFDYSTFLLVSFQCPYMCVRRRVCVCASAVIYVYLCSGMSWLLCPNSVFYVSQNIPK